MTCITVWKRFNDIKALLKFIKKRHKSERLNGVIPTLSNQTFFKRFEADVITERKLFIIRLLDFVGQHSVLYKSQAFQDFFATSQVMPKEESLQFQADDIPSEDTFDGAVAASDPITDSDGTPSSSLNESFESSSMSTPIIDSPAENSDDGFNQADDFTSNLRDASTVACTNYVFNTEYVFQNPIETPCQPNQSKDLSKFKVLRMLDSVMQVQDMTTKHIYIMKVQKKQHKLLFITSYFCMMYVVEYALMSQLFIIFSQLIRYLMHPKNSTYHRIFLLWSHLLDIIYPVHLFTCYLNKQRE